MKSFLEALLKSSVWAFELRSFKDPFKNLTLYKHKKQVKKVLILLLHCTSSNQMVYKKFFLLYYFVFNANRNSIKNIYLNVIQAELKNQFFYNFWEK